MSVTIRPTGGHPPPRAAWPEPPPQSPAGRALTESVLLTFRLNARLVEAAESMAAEGDMTAAWWQVLGGVLDEPRTLADIGRRMGMSRQGVRRVASLLVERGLAEYWPNPAHRRAQLLACTEAGYWAVRRISLAAHPWADRIGSHLALADLEHLNSSVQGLIDALEADQSRHDREGVSKASALIGLSQDDQAATDQPPRERRRRNQNRGDGHAVAKRAAAAPPGAADQDQ